QCPSTAQASGAEARRTLSDRPRPIETGLDMKPDKNNVKSILFITLSNLGDILLTTPVLEKLCDEFPGASVDIITGSPGRDIFAAHPKVREVKVHKKRSSLADRLKNILEIRRKKYDMVVDLKNSLIPYLSGARFRTGIFDLSNRRRHKSKEHLAKLAGLGIEPFSRIRFFLPVLDEDRRFADQVLSSGRKKKTVTLNPGAKSHLKRWDSGKFAALADRLVSELDCDVLVCGNEDDRETVRKVVSSVKSKVQDLCCRTTLGSLFEIMRRCDLVITNDSAPLHMASMANVATVAIFGPSDEERYGPLSEKSKVIKPLLSCRPCGKALCSIGPDEGCISRITVEEVFKAAKELLGG
ncbi:MAG: glycosyltransferase family 9 protein, partial [Candidatus Omnitrophota bacterium]